MITIRNVGPAAVLVLLFLATPAAAQHTHARQDGPQIPESMRLEHEEIHGRLEAAAQEPGAVGDAARQLAAILDPHFRRENQIALPPLALLAGLARGDMMPAMAQILPLTDSLRAELPNMLEEHVHIAAAARRLEHTAREHGNAEVADLARTLQRHARTEEEVYYPTAVLVGDVVRARMRQDRSP